MGLGIFRTGLGGCGKASLEIVEDFLPFGGQIVQFARGTDETGFFLGVLLPVETEDFVGFLLGERIKIIYKVVGFPVNFPLDGGLVGLGLEHGEDVAVLLPFGILGVFRVRCHVAVLVVPNIVHYETAGGKAGHGAVEVLREEVETASVRMRKRG